MGWAKYDEDIRDIIEERWNDQNTCYGYMATPQIRTETTCAPATSEARTDNRNENFAKRYAGTVRN